MPRKSRKQIRQQLNERMPSDLIAYPIALHLRQTLPPLQLATSLMPISRSPALNFLLLFLLLSSVHTQSHPDHPRLHPHSTLDDIHSSLFNPPSNPFTSQDQWTYLSSSHRTLWTSSHSVTRPTAPLSDLIPPIHRLHDHPVSLPVSLQIIAPPHLLNQTNAPLLSQYTPHLKTSPNPTVLTIQPSLAPYTLYTRLSLLSSSHTLSDFHPILHPFATTLSTPNIIFLILAPSDSPLSSFPTDAPFISPYRHVWSIYPVPNQIPLNLPLLLATAERIAQRIFAPTPFYFPLPLIPQINFQLNAYTPSHDHRALWLHNFGWTDFEHVIRNIAIPGQTVAFSSAQSNQECSKCEQAFDRVDKYNHDFPNNSVVVLNHGLLPDANWSLGATAPSGRRQISAGTFRLYVLDVVNLKKSPYMERMERHAVYNYPGVCIVTVRSTDRTAVANLETWFARAFLTGVYGVAEPELYMQSKQGEQLSKRTAKPSAVLYDIVVRYAVRSVVVRRMKELQEIVEAMRYFEIDPKEALGDQEHTNFMQRVNLMLYKLQRAQELLGESIDTSAALYMAISSSHDMRAIRAAFQLEEGSKSFERFRDPTLRCHFSRLRREALRASRMLESGYPRAKRIGVVIFSYVGGMIGASFLLQTLSLRKLRGKRE